MGCIGSAGCEVHVDVHGSELCCEWLQVNCYTEHDRYGLPCLYAETVECMSSAGSVWYVGVEVLLWNFVATEHGRYKLSSKWKTME